MYSVNTVSTGVNLFHCLSTLAEVGQRRASHPSSCSLLPENSGSLSGSFAPFPPPPHILRPFWFSRLGPWGGQRFALPPHSFPLRLSCTEKSLHSAVCRAVALSKECAFSATGNTACAFRSPDLAPCDPATWITVNWARCQALTPRRPVQDRYTVV